MVKAGLLARGQGGGDRRQVRLTVSPAGRKKLEKLRDLMEERLAKKIAALEPARRRKLEAGLDVLMEVVR